MFNALITDGYTVFFVSYYSSYVSDDFSIHPLHLVKDVKHKFFTPIHLDE